MGGPSNSDLQRQLLQAREDNLREHSEIKAMFAEHNVKLDKALAQITVNTEKLKSCDLRLQETESGVKAIEAKTLAGLVVAVVALLGLVGGAIWGHVFPGPMKP